MNEPIRIDPFQLTAKARGWMACHPLARPRRETPAIALIEAAAHGDLPVMDGLVTPWIAELAAFLSARLQREPEATVLLVDLKDAFRSHQACSNLPCPGTQTLGAAIQARMLALLGLGLRHDITTPAGLKRGWQGARLLPRPPRDWSGVPLVLREPPTNRGQVGGLGPESVRTDATDG